MQDHPTSLHFTSLHLFTLNPHLKTFRLMLISTKMTLLNSEQKIVRVIDRHKADSGREMFWSGQNLLQKIDRRTKRCN
jgi:hypothetical protein